MVYQGSKRKILDKILPFIQSTIDKNHVENYYEFFVGGANVIDSVKCKNRYGSDINDELISLLIYMRDNPTLPIAPQDCSFEHYSDVRESRKLKDGRYSKEYIALIGYFASFGGRYFNGGYGRDAKGGRCIYKERLNFALNQAVKLKGIDFKCCSWEEYNVDDFENGVIYLDPPYRDSKEYDSMGNFDYEKFYDFCRQLGKNNYVFISEYNMPNDFNVVWSEEVKVLQKSDRNKGDIVLEKLFYIGKNSVLFGKQVDDIFDL